MLRGRQPVKFLVALLVAVLVSLLPVTSTHAEPDIGQVEDRVDRLYHEAEQASERYNDVRVELDELRRDLAALEADQERQAERLDEVRVQVEDSVVRQYQGQAVSNVGQVLVAEDPGAFLGQLSTMSEFNDLQSQLFEDYATELKALTIREEATADRVAEIAAAERRAKAEKTTLDDKLAKAKSLLSRLKAEERAEIASRSGATPSSAELPDVPVSGRAAAAVQYALAQVGKAYVYGATGPSAFDCSGLTMRAWGAAGVGLPHSSRAQMGYGAPVSSSALQPGDLVFYYSPVSHVGIYIGGGKIVHAARPGVGVVVSDVFSMPFSGAVRPG